VKGACCAANGGFMKKIILSAIFFGYWTLAGGALAAQAPDLRDAPVCKTCGMDRAAFDYSRMLIEFDDGTKVSTCSLHCSAEELVLNRGKKVKAILVADYGTKVLIDAGSATWVIGGSRKGVMTSRPKWAFLDRTAAEAFVKENGGSLATFDDALKAAFADLYEDVEFGPAHKDGPPNAGGADEGAHAGHAGHVMDSGSQLLFNPAFGGQIYHNHPEGMWMVDSTFTRTDMEVLRHNTTDVGVNSAVSQYGYMTVPTKMRMDMGMVMAMYGVTDRFTLMGMAGYQANEMNMIMNMGMGMGNTAQPPMSTNGIGDVELRGIYGFTKNFLASLGVSVPTGSIDERVAMMNAGFRAPYDMQLGSGTWDLKPSLTYWGFTEDKKWNWGAQAEYTYRTARNEYHYNLGNDLSLTSWIQRSLGPFAASFRFAYTNWGQIQGRDPAIDSLLAAASLPDADPHNYGGQLLEGLIGLAYQKGAFSVGAEFGKPLYQNLNGLQLERDWILSGTIQMMF